MGGAQGGTPPRSLNSLLAEDQSWKQIHTYTYMTTSLA